MNRLVCRDLDPMCMWSMVDVWSPSNIPGLSSGGAQWRGVSVSHPFSNEKLPHVYKKIGIPPKKTLPISAAYFRQTRIPTYSNQVENRCEFGVGRLENRRKIAGQTADNALSAGRRSQYRGEVDGNGRNGAIVDKAKEEDGECRLQCPAPWPLGVCCRFRDWQKRRNDAKTEAIDLCFHSTDVTAKQG